MKIIAHRGARGEELENSLASLQAALTQEVDAIEFDVHLTSDDEVVIMHDPTTLRTAGKNVQISETTLEELREVQLKNGQQIPTLKEVLPLMSGRHVFIDIKADGCADNLVPLLADHPQVSVSFESYRPSEMARIRELLPDAATYVYFLKAQNFVARPFKMVRVAKAVQASGVSIDKFYLLNPLTYYLVRRQGYEMIAYSVSSKTLVRLLKLLYPALGIITGRPDIINHHSFPSP